MTDAFASSLLLAQTDPQQKQSTLGWCIHSLSDFTGLLVLVSASLIFAGAVYLVKTRQRPAAFAAYLVLLPLPTLIAMFGTMNGMFHSFLVISLSPGLSLSQQDYAGGFASTLVLMIFTWLVSAPTYFVLAYGLLRGTMRPRFDGGHTAVKTVLEPRPSPPSISPIPSAT